MNGSLLGWFCAGVMAATGCAVAERPALNWWSAPTKPGETLELFGGAWGANAKLKYGGRVIAPVKRTETGLWFVLPKDLPMTGAPATVVSDGGESDPFAPNAPDLWWVQGEKGAAACAGGWLRAFGRGLDAGGRATMRLVNADGKAFPLVMTARDVWRLDAQVPSGIPAGDYTVEVANGLERGRAAMAVRVVPPGEVWKATRFDVTDYGAVPNDRHDDTMAIRAALDAARANGGGTVFFPRGRYQLCDSIRIPPYTCLKGEGRNLASLYWLDGENPPEALIYGEHSFGIEDLFIHSANYANGLMLDTPLARRHSLTSTRTMVSHDITLRRCKFKFIVDQWYCYSKDLFERRYFQRGNGVDLRDVRNVTVEDCDIYASKEDMSTLYFLVTGENVLMRRCRINGHGWSVIGGDRVIFEENQSLNCTYSISKITRNFYFGRNRQYDLFNNNRESVTHDGSMTAFTRRKGPPGSPGYTVGAQVDGCHVKLLFDQVPEDGNVNSPAAFWKGYELQIVAGRGVGQTRTIAAIGSYAELTLARPFAIAPDATSRFVICAERRHLLYADNDTEDSSYAIQLYGGVTDCTLARNRCRRAGGFRGEGRNYHGIIPCWGVQFVGNVVEEGNGYRDVHNSPIPGDTVIGALCVDRNLSLTRAYVLRDNVLENNARIEATSEDALVENNVIRHADLGIDASRFAETVLCRGNRFEDVRRPYAKRFLDQADMPEERARLAAAERREREAAFAGGKPVTAEKARELLGIEVTCRPWEQGIRQAIVSEAAITKGALKMIVSVSAAQPGSTLEIAADFDQKAAGPWHFADKVTVKLDKAGDASVDYPYALDAGPRGLFSMPVRCTCRRADGKSLAWRDNLAVFTQNRLCKWEIARGAFPATGWKRVTKYNPHEMVMPYAEFPGLKPGEEVTLRTTIKVTRPVYLNLMIEGHDALPYDAKHKPIVWNSLAPVLWQPGEYPVYVVKTYKRDRRDSGDFKVIFRAFDSPVPPGAIECRLVAPKKGQ